MSGWGWSPEMLGLVAILVVFGPMAVWTWWDCARRPRAPSPVRRYPFESLERDAPGPSWDLRDLNRRFAAPAGEGPVEEGSEPARKG